jgi:hypothetical protein
MFVIGLLRYAEGALNSRVSLPASGESGIEQTRLKPVHSRKSVDSRRSQKRFELLGDTGNRRTTPIRRDLADSNSLTRIREGQFLEKSGDADQAEKAKKGRVIFGLCRRSFVESVNVTDAASLDRRFYLILGRAN